MLNLEKYASNAETQIDPLVKCFVVHYQIEAIHPFEDGNGRVGRALLALMIYKALEHKRPWLYLSAFFDRYRDEYINSMFEVSASGQWDAWIDFCLTGAIAQANDSIRRCDKFKELKVSYHQRVTSPTPRTHSMIDSLFRSQIITVASIKKLSGVHYSTAKADIEKLVEHGILKELTGMYPKAYYAHEIMAVAYDW